MNRWLPFMVSFHFFRGTGKEGFPLVLGGPAGSKAVLIVDGMNYEGR